MTRQGSVRNDSEKLEMPPGERDGAARGGRCRLWRRKRPIGDDKEKRLGRKKFKIFVIIGLLLLAIGLYWGEYVRSSEIARAAGISSVAGYTDSLISAGILLLQTLGAAFIAIGVFNIAIETEHWTQYFEERLRGVVTHTNYLRTLNIEELGKIRNEVLKSHFRDDKIDREGGFLKFFDNHIYKLIGTPYRESLRVIIEVSPTDDQRRWQVRDQARYTCRSVGGSIQSNVRYVSEGVELSSLKIDAIYPGDSASDKKGKPEELIHLNEEQLAKYNKFDQSLEKYKDEDGLIIEQDAVYYVEKDSFQSVIMLVPTKRFDIQIRFPINAKIQSEVIILDSALISKKQGDGWLSISSDAWILPESGLVWRVFEGNKVV